MAALAGQRAANGVEVVAGRRAASCEVPGEAVTDPVAYTLALAAAAERRGAEVRTRRARGGDRGGTATRSS